MNRIFAALAAITAPGVSAAQVHVAEGGEVLLEAPAGAADWAWDLDDDGVFDDCAREPECLLSAAGRDGPVEIELSVYADDVFGNESVVVDNVAPTIVSEPPHEARRGGRYSYLPEVNDPAGESDPWTLELVDEAFPDGMEADPITGEIVWVPRADQLGEHEVTIVVLDDDGGRAEQSWSIEVRDNAAPFGPSLLYPRAGDCIMVDRPTFKVGNAADIDGDPLTYHFEVDKDPGFRSIDLQQSDPVPEGESGFTEWQTPRALTNCEHYYWRAWASDGAAESERITETFEVCVKCGGYYDDPHRYGEGPEDVPAVDDPGVTAEPGAGCACRTPRDVRPSDGWIGMLCLASLLGLGRRRS